MIKKILTGVLLLFVTAIIAVFATSITSTQASPLLTDPTPTPVITYWLGSSQNFTAVAGASGTSWGLPSGGYIYDIDGDTETDFVAPEGQQPGGMLIVLNYVNYTGDNSLVYGTNTNWFQKFNDYWTSGANEMTPGEITCNGTTEACSAVGYAVDPDHDWEGSGLISPGGLYYFKQIRVGHQLGAQYATTNFTIIPIFYGEWEECESVTPATREFISSGLLQGDDDEGETFMLMPGKQYVLYTNAGPWNDGIDDRYDIAVRFRTSHSVDPPSGEWGEWTPLEDVFGGLGICSDEFLDEHGTAFMFEAVVGEQAFIQFRVNDVEDEFDDNSGDLEYFWLGEEGSSQGCEDQWTVGSKVGGHTVPATTEWIYRFADYYRGGRYDGRVGPGESYLYKVTGSYLDNGIESTDSIVQAGADGTPWTDPADAFVGSNDQCDDETEDALYYYGTTVSSWNPNIFNLPGKYPYGGINDDTGSPGNNSGEITLEWYEGSWTAPRSDCSTKYNRGTYIEDPVVLATNANGVFFPQTINGLTIGQVYYLEAGTTPYYLNGTRSWDFEIRNPALADPWQDPEEFFDCITPLDQNRSGYYWIADRETFYLRAEFGIGGHGDNSGSLKMKLYGAIPNQIPDGESCGDYYSLDRLAWRGSMDADETLYSIDHSVFTTGDKYLIKVISPPYTEPDGTGKTMDIRRSAPSIGSVEWSDPEEWDAGLCYEQLDGYDHIYFKAETLSDYEVRANTPVGNSGTFSFEVWELNEIKSTVLGCEYNYSTVPFWYLLKDKEDIYANSKGAEYDGNGNVTVITGYVMAESLTADTRNYKIETGYLNNRLTPPQWDLQISYDGGKTWIFLADWVDCWVDLGTPEGRGYFTSPVAGGPFILRVYDVGGVYLDNVGGVDFSMWIDTATGDPGNIFTNPVSPSAWGVGCLPGGCPKPGFFQVGEWVEYARCRFTSWLSWCPSHSKDMADIQTAFMDVEPFRTIFEMISLGRLIRAEVESYSWTNDGGGSGEGVAEVLVPPNYIFMPGEGGGAGFDPNALTGPNSIWGTGEIDLQPTGTNMYRTECDTALSEALGTRLGAPMCFAFNVLDQLGLRMWFQMFWDFFMCIAFVMYINRFAKELQ